MLKYLDNQTIRSISSENFNYAFDKESKVSITWGINENDDPPYDPISPQELIFKIKNKTSLIDFINIFNILANVYQEKQKNKKYEKIKKIENNNDFINLCNNINLKIFSTLSIITLDLNDINLNICKNILKYLNLFNLPVNIQINENIDKSIINELRFISPNIILYLNEKNIETYKLLLKQNFNVNIKMTFDNFNFISQLNVLKELDKNTKGKIYLFDPLISYNQLIELEGRIKNLKLNYIYLASCNLNKFNTNQKIFKHTIEILNCDGCTFSSYIDIDKNKLYPCEFQSKTLYKDIKQNDNISQIWQSDKISKFRQKIINNGFC